MAHFATMLHGSLEEVMNELDSGDCTAAEVAAALSNTIRQVLALQKAAACPAYQPLLTPVGAGDGNTFAVG